MSTIADRFKAAGFPNIGKLYTHTDTTGLTDCGSSSISPTFSEAVEEVKRVMRERGGVRPSNERSAALWASIGDASATFYFSGYRIVEGNEQRVTTSLYLTILADHLDEISPGALLKIDDLAKVFSSHTRQDLE